MVIFSVFSVFFGCFCLFLGVFANFFEFLGVFGCFLVVSGTIPFQVTNLAKTPEQFGFWMNKTLYFWQIVGFLCNFGCFWVFF